MKHYLKIYKQLAIYNFSALVASRLDFFTLLIGKFLRMGFLFVFILGIFEFIPDLAGYTKGEIVLFYAFFNLLDLFVQIFFFRGFWFLQEYVQTGEFDKILTYPISPIFLTAFKILDWMDVVTLLPASALLCYGLLLNGGIGGLGGIGSVAMTVTGIMTAFGFCLFLSGITFFTTRMSNVWWLYRDLATMARFPLSIFPATFAAFLTYVIPVGIIFNYPAKAVLGNMGFTGYAVSLLLAVFWIFIGKKFWDFSLKRYSSASS